MGKRCNILFLGEGDSFGDICYSLNLYSAKLGMKTVVVLDITRKKKSKAMSWTGEIECISFSLSACGHNFWGKEALSKNLIWPKEHINYNFLVGYSL